MALINEIAAAWRLMAYNLSEGWTKEDARSGSLKASASVTSTSNRKSVSSGKSRENQRTSQIAGGSNGKISEKQRSSVAASRDQRRAPKGRVWRKMAWRWQVKASSAA